jgi:hypothetical protein
MFVKRRRWCRGVGLRPRFIVSFTFSDIGIQSPTFESWCSGNTPSAIS